MKRWFLAVTLLLVGGVLGTLITSQVLQGQNAAPAPIVFPKELTSYRDVVKRALPAVVSIQGLHAKAKAEQPAPKRKGRLDDDSPIPKEFREFFEELEKRQEEIPSIGFGSGFLIDPKGTVLTNFHVVAGADQVEVQLKDGRKVKSKDIHGDKKTDLAIVRIDVKGPVPFLELGDSDAMEIGDRVLAVGAPFGLTGSVTAGIVSAKGRNGLNVNMYEDFIQTDAAINPGNSGGPLVNLEGKVIGINSAIKSRTGGFQGVGLAIASNMAKNIMQQLLTDGLVHRGYLGVEIKDIINSELAERLGVKEEGGVLVGKVMEDSPAAKGGLQDGDVVTAVAGKKINGGKELQQAVASLPLHKPVDVTVVRDGKAKILKVTIEEQPENFGSNRQPALIGSAKRPDGIALEKIGAEVADLTPELAERLNFKENATGALVTNVERDSAAREAGLAAGMLIVKVDKKPVKSAKDVQDLLEKGSLEKGVLFQVQVPQGGVAYLILKAQTTK